MPVAARDATGSPIPARYAINRAIALRGKKYGERHGTAELNPNKSQGSEFRWSGAEGREQQSVGGGRDQKFGFHRGSGPGRSESEPRSGPVLVLVLVLVRVPVLVRVRVWVPAWSWSWSWSWSLVGKTKCSFRLFQAVQRDLLFVPNFGPWSLVRVRVGSLILVLVQPRGWSWSWPSPGPGPVPVLPSPSPGFGPVLARSGPGPGGWSGSRPPPSFSWAATGFVASRKDP